MADKDISRPFEQNLRAKVGGNIRLPGGVGGGVSVSGGTDGFAVSPNVGLNGANWGLSVNPANGDVTRSIPLPYGGYGEYKTGEDQKRSIGFGVRGDVGNTIGVKGGIEYETKGDIAFPSQNGTTKIAPGLYTRKTRLGTFKDKMPEVQVDSIARLPNGKEVLVRRDRTALPPQNINDILYGDVDRAGPGSFPTQDVIDAFGRALKADPQLFDGTPDISRNAFDTQRFPLGKPLGVVDRHNDRDGIVSTLMRQAQEIAGRPEVSANIRKIGRALWAAKMGRLAP